MDKAANAHLHRQLVKLGDMIGDGLHLEPDGKWISKEYRQVAQALGLLPKEDRSARIEAINKQMVKRVADVKCGKCNGELKQTRSGAKRAKCQSCGGLWQLLK
ncbi:hypothetical protein [Marinomonas ostreistagni]|uniref:DksA C4-type domain-containing protein n=1 Tax=Marinomonas ostreistagni TaxID=359209 RepID=A0ABS0ZAT1_9GAMM|nr:hypothetical protein [Marinomonas ostreistagni]MBJ7550766.1 hypothetical protein [Marinomonas ostreistagni]